VTCPEGPPDSIELLTDNALGDPCNRVGDSRSEGLISQTGAQTLTKLFEKAFGSVDGRWDTGLLDRPFSDAQPRLVSTRQIGERLVKIVEVGVEAG
jgi:hypothetical protein